MSVAPNPLHAFRFRVTFTESRIGPGGRDRDSRGAAARGSELCHGAFSEVSGLEAVVEPCVIREGGLNWGAHQRVGRVTFGTVIFKRGVNADRRLWKWFQQVHGGSYAARLHVYVTLQGPPSGKDGKPADLVTWKLHNALPIKMKLTDLNATSNEVGVEELHLACESITEIQESR